MDFSGFIENLKTHEMEMKVREEREAPKKKAIAFKATLTIHDEDDSSEDCDEDFAMLIRKVGKMFYKKVRQSNFRRGKPQGRYEKKREEPGPCFHCKKIGHLIADCPALQATTSKHGKKKKALAATWDDSESESEEEHDAANMCFMAQGEDSSKVCLETSIDDDDLTMDELAQFFEELQHRYEISQSHNKKLKKENDVLKNKYDICLNEKNVLSSAFKKLKSDFEKYKLANKGKTPMVSCNKNEFVEIQKRVEVLDSTLKKCAFDFNKLASRFPKGIAQGKHVHHKHSTRSHKHAHTHNHAFMYNSGRIYICTHCGRKGHLEKFCYAKNNVKNKFVWVRPGSNPKGATKIWVPKDPPIVDETGGSSSSKT